MSHSRPTNPDDQNIFSELAEENNTAYPIPCEINQSFLMEEWLQRAEENPFLEEWRSVDDLMFEPGMEPVTEHGFPCSQAVSENACSMLPLGILTPENDSLRVYVETEVETEKNVVEAAEITECDEKVCDDDEESDREKTGGRRTRHTLSDRIFYELIYDANDIAAMKMNNAGEDIRFSAFYTEVEQDASPSVAAALLRNHLREKRREKKMHGVKYSISADWSHNCVWVNVIMKNAVQKSAQNIIDELQTEKEKICDWLEMRIVRPVKVQETFERTGRKEYTKLKNRCLYQKSEQHPMLYLHDENPDSLASLLCDYFHKSGMEKQIRFARDVNNRALKILLDPMNGDIAQQKNTVKQVLGIEKIDTKPINVPGFVINPKCSAAADKKRKHKKHLAQEDQQEHAVKIGSKPEKTVQEECLPTLAKRLRNSYYNESSPTLFAHHATSQQKTMATLRHSRQRGQGKK